MDFRIRDEPDHLRDAIVKIVDHNQPLQGGCGRSYTQLCSSRTTRCVRSRVHRFAVPGMAVSDKIVESATTPVWQQRSPPPERPSARNSPTTPTSGSKKPPPQTTRSRTAAAMWHCRCRVTIASDDRTGKEVREVLRRQRFSRRDDQRPIRRDTPHPLWRAEINSRNWVRTNIVISGRSSGPCKRFGHE